MSKLFYELRERLLRAGVAPRQVRRYLTELGEHLADLRTEEEGAGCSAVDAEAAALTRLGAADDLARAIIAQRQFRSWSVRAPWAIFGVAPLVLLAGAYLLACFILWSGWKIFLPDAGMPFVRVDGFAAVYFGAGRLLYFLAPILVGWGVAWIAARQRLKAAWPTVGLALLAFIGAAARVHAGSPGGVGHVSMDLAIEPSLRGLSDGLIHVTVIFLVAAMPWVVWRLRLVYSSSV